MKCPACSHETFDREDPCSVCAFTLADLNERAAALPSEKPSDDVHDPDRVLGRVGEARIRDRFDRFETRTDGEFRLVILPSVKPLNGPEAAFWFFNRWSLGGEAKRAILLLLATGDRLVHCEVGYGFEPCLADSEVAKVLDFHVVPLLRKGATDEALFQGVHLLSELIETSPHLDGVKAAE
jgi:uncharacterized membrane protein YgcG